VNGKGRHFRKGDRIDVPCASEPGGRLSGTIISLLWDVDDPLKLWGVRIRRDGNPVILNAPLTWLMKFYKGTVKKP
jgi:hypothetical protein